MTAERDRVKAQRDSFSQQFETLSKKRTTETEALFEKYKAKVAVAQQGRLYHSSVQESHALTVSPERHHLQPDAPH